MRKQNESCAARGAEETEQASGKADNTDAVHSKPHAETDQALRDSPCACGKDGCQPSKRGSVRILQMAIKLESKVLPEIINQDVCEDVKEAIELLRFLGETRSIMGVVNQETGEVKVLREKVIALEQENTRRIRHLNRLGTWAQQDPTGPSPQVVYEISSATLQRMRTLDRC